MASILKGLLAPVLFVGLVASSCSNDKQQAAEQAAEMDHAVHDMSGHTDAAPAAEVAVIDAVTGYVDPVCKMKIAEDAPIRHTHDGVTFGFCSTSCKDRFSEDPAKYLAAIEE